MRGTIRSALRREGGFTLLELVVALAIAATTVTMLQVIANSAYRSAGDTSLKRRAKIMLREKAEAIATGAETGTSGEFDGDNEGFRWESSEQTLEVTTRSGAVVSVPKLTVSVRYPSREGDSGPHAGGGSTGDPPGTVRVTVLLDPSPQEDGAGSGEGTSGQ